MSQISIKIKNLREIKAAFGASPQLMTKNLNSAIEKTVLDIQAGEVREYSSLGIHKITHKLIESINAGKYVGNLRGEVGPDAQGGTGAEAPYAGFVHDGTKFMRSRPFLLNAVHDKQKNVDNFFKEAVQTTLNQIGAKV